MLKRNVRGGKPSDYPRWPFHGLRCAQLLSSMTVSGIMAYFIYYLSECSLVDFVLLRRRLTRFSLSRERKFPYSLDVHRGAFPLFSSELGRLTDCGMCSCFQYHSRRSRPSSLQSFYITLPSFPRASTWV